MEKIIEIDGKEVKFKTSAAIPLLYRMKFKRDIMTDMQHISKQMRVQEKLKREMQEDCEKKGIPFDEDQFQSDLSPETLEIFEKIAFLMARHADPGQPDNIVEWMEQFDTFSIYKIFPEIFELWQSGTTQMSKPKKGNGK